MTKIDAHIHVNGDTEACLTLLKRLDLKLFNVCVAHAGGEAWRTWRDAFQSLTDEHPARFAWCTTFDVPDFSADYAERVIAELERDFAAGAIACKFWKNIGMEIRKPSGEFLMIDDPLFDPIFDYLARNEIPALMHLGEPLACWQPLDENRPHYGYYSQHPEWHMYYKPDYPSHRQIIDARDRMLAQHPKLRVIGAHLGSLEYDVAEIAARLDRYPNFAVDTSARMNDLAVQDPDTVRQFLTAYAGRVLFGTDIVARDPLSGMTEEEREKRVARFEAVYRREFTYYETEETLTVANREVRGLGLPAEVLDQLYYESAAAWYPGVLFCGALCPNASSHTARE
jgi:predicted TIM-barrel fold metal-dependent hydrolase